MVFILASMLTTVSGYGYDAPAENRQELREVLHGLYEKREEWSIQKKCIRYVKMRYIFGFM